MTIPNAKDDGSNIENDNAEFVNKNTDDHEDQGGSEGADDEEEMTPENFKKYKELAHNYKIRAEKAERGSKETKDEPKKANPTKPNTKTDDFSTKDMYSLIKADIPEEDFERVGNYAKLNKISIADALKDEDLQIILKRQAEKRETAKAANMGQRRTGNQKVSDQKLLEDAQKGNLPENEDDIERLAKARIAARKAGK